MVAWVDPAPHPGPYPITVRFSGRRIDVKGRLLPGDRFVQDETIEEVIPGSGPISLTARVHGINPGEWAVTAHMLGTATPAPFRGRFFLSLTARLPPLRLQEANWAMRTPANVPSATGFQLPVPHKW